MPHVHEKIDFVADAYIVHNNRVLLRMHDKYKKWLPSGGHIELDEDPNQAAIREAKEEVGLDIELVGSVSPLAGNKNYLHLLAPRFMHRHKINDAHEHISLAYFATSKTDHIQQGETEVSDEVRWFTNDELDDPTFGIDESIRYYAHAALKELEKKS